MNKPLGGRVPAHLIFKYFGGKKMIISLDAALGKIEVLESTIKFLEDEIEGYKIAIQGCNEVFERNKKLKKDIELFHIAMGKANVECLDLKHKNKMLKEKRLGSQRDYCDYCGRKIGEQMGY